MATEENTPHLFPKIKRKKIVRIALAALVAIVILFFAGRKIGIIPANKAANGKSAVANQGQIIKIDKKFTFPGLDDTAKKSGNIELRITTAEKTDQVIVQDKTYTAKNNKTFLIVNLELKNDTTKKLNINTGDLTRLVIVAQEEKKFAPDLHNNYVLVAPISTKVDRLGFVIDKDVKSFKLQIGELEGDKEIVPLQF